MPLIRPELAPPEYEIGFDAGTGNLESNGQGQDNEHMHANETTSLDLDMVGLWFNAKHTRPVTTDFALVTRVLQPRVHMRRSFHEMQQSSDRTMIGPRCRPQSGMTETAWLWGRKGNVGRREGRGDIST
jgi:hypothetical protein